MKSLCSLFLSLSIFLVLVCVGCDSAMQQNEKTDLVFSFRTPNFRSTQSIEDNPTLLIEACLVDYDGKTIQKTEKEISSGEAVSFQFLKIATNINIKVKIQVFVKGDESPSYTGESDWILTQAGANKVSIMLEKVKPSLFEIIFNSMGGSEVPPQVLESGVVEKPENPTKEGYIFDDWYTSSNNGETLESVFDFDTPIEKDLTLYAKWTPISYTVKFDANNENATGTMDVQNFTYDKAANLNKNAFEVENYGFVEWNTKSDGSGTAYLDEAEILNLTEENGAEIVLYAQWIETSTAADYKVEHYRQNIEDDEYTLFETEDKVGTTGETTTASAKSYEGFTAKDFTQAVIAGDGTTIVEIYYDRKDVTLTFDLAGGMSGGSTKIEKTGKYGASVEVPTDPKRENYTFDGWDKTVPESFPANDETYTAKWIDINQVASVTFSIPAGNVSKNTTITLSCATEGATIYYRTSEKDEFVIYDSNASLVITEETTITAYAICEGMIDSENTSATYKLYQYTLAFETNAGSEITDSNSYSDGATVKLAFQTTREGYTFAGWYMSADYSGDSVTELTFSQEMEGLDKDSNTVTLSAKWTPISYTVKFDAKNENATGSMDAQNFTYDKAANLNKNAFEVENYGFVEWNTKSDGSGTAYLDEAEILNLTEENGAEIVLYAQWIETSTAADYKVEHYRQNIEDDEYTLFETEDKVGTTGETTTASAKSYEGFTAKDFTQAVIAGDGTTIVEIYYDRKDVTLTFDLAGGMSGDSTKIEKTGKYGAPVEKPEDPTKNGYIFDDWYTSSNNGETLESVFDFDTPIEKDLTLYAKWIEIKTSIEVTFPSYDDPEGLITYDEGSQTFTAKEGYSSYEWFIDGKLQGGDQSFILNTGNMTGGIYTVMLIVTTESGDMYSAEWQVTITKIGEN